MRIYLALFFLVITYSFSFSQKKEKYWLYHTASEASSIKDSLDNWSIQLNFHSDWINAYSTSLDETQLLFLRGKLKRKKIEKAGHLVPLFQKDHTAKELGYALEQINAEALISQKLTGKGVKIGIVDGGFLNAPSSKSLVHLFENNKIANYKDFITPKLKHYGGYKKLDDQHGTDVWEMIGGINIENKIQFGLATRATYYLARTDHGAGEKRIEEDYFIAALEWMSKQGVRLVNTSLGYTNGYNNPKENYTPEQMDGSSAIAKATQHAIEEKGMIIVGAAGNEGNLPWKVINTPADAKGVISVGASKNTLLDKMGYSSIGPLYLDYIKPELTCFSSSGTSFSAPIITGLVACMIEQDPTLTNSEIKSILLQSCSLYPYGNNYIGYGNPDGAKIIKSLLTNDPIESNVNTVYHKNKRFWFKNRFRIKSDGKTVVIYHKYDHWKVLEKKLILSDKKKITVIRPNKVTQSTVVAGSKILEIFWDSKK